MWIAFASTNQILLVSSEYSSSAGVQQAIAGIFTDYYGCNSGWVSNHYKVHTYRFQNGVDCYIKYKRKILIYYTLVYWCWGKQCVLDIFTDPKAAMSPEDFSSRGWHCSPRDCKTQCYSIGSQTGGVQLCMYCIYCTRQNS